MQRYNRSNFAAYSSCAATVLRANLTELRAHDEGARCDHFCVFKSSFIKSQLYSRMFASIRIDALPPSEHGHLSR